jgi:hypothetical protein
VAGVRPVAGALLAATCALRTGAAAPAWEDGSGMVLGGAGGLGACGPTEGEPCGPAPGEPDGPAPGEPDGPAAEELGAHVPGAGEPCANGLATGEPGAGGPAPCPLSHAALKYLHAQALLQERERLTHHHQEENPRLRMPRGW